MTEFVRVRSAKGPRAEYLVGRPEFVAHPDRYTEIKPSKGSKSSPSRGSTPSDGPGATVKEN